MKFRVTVTFVREYNAKPEHYPEGCSVGAMRRIDREAICDDPFIMLDHPDTRMEVRVKEVE